MPFVAAPNIVMVEIVGTKDGQRIENRFHVNVFHEPTPVDLAGIEAIVASFINLNYSPLLSTQVVITDIKQTSLHTQNGITKNASFTVPGTVGGVALPNETTYCVSLKSGVRGRSARGRFYVMSVSQGQMVDQNRVTGAYRTAITAAVQTLIDSLAAGSNAWEIVSYITNGAPRPGGPVYFEVLTATTFDDIVDSQRRRRPGVGT